MPPMLLALTVVAALGTGLFNVVIALQYLIYLYARVLRASVLTVKDKEYIESARAVGASNVQIIEVCNTKFTCPIIVQGTLVWQAPYLQLQVCLCRIRCSASASGVGTYVIQC